MHRLRLVCLLFVAVVVTGCDEPRPQTGGVTFPEEAPPTADPPNFMPAPVSGAPSQNVIGDYTFVEQADALDDTDESMIVTFERNSSGLRPAALAWICSGPDMRVGVLADEFLNSEGLVPVRWRFERAQASMTQPWRFDARGDGVLAPRGILLGFTERAMVAGTVVVRVTDYRGVDHDLEFSLNGLSLALERLRCFAALSDPLPQDLCNIESAGFPAGYSSVLVDGVLIPAGSTVDISNEGVLRVRSQSASSGELRAFYNCSLPNTGWVPDGECWLRGDNAGVRLCVRPSLGFVVLDLRGTPVRR
jgi:hypothetical protein